MEYVTRWLERFQTPSGELTLAVLVASTLTPLRLLLNKCVFEPLATVAFSRQPKTGDGAENNSDRRIRLQKWNEACWKASFRIFIMAVGLVVSINQKFFTDSHHFWEGCTQFPPCNFTDISLGLHLLFVIELGFYIDALPFLMFFEVRRRDFWENFGHHLATIALLVYASHLNFQKVGAMVILCHEINDIFMEAAKMARYAEHPTAPNVLFVLFALSWIASRLIYFPLFVIRSVYTEPPKIAEKYGQNQHPHWEIFLGLLCFLFILHVYWSVLIGRIVALQLSGKGVDDIREEAPIKAQGMTGADQNFEKQ